MKFRVTMKDPDVLDDAIRDAAQREVDEIEGLDASERVDLIDSRTSHASDLCGRWWQYGELLTVEVDTDAMTAIVVPQ